MVQHAAICCDRQGMVLNMVAREFSAARRASAELARERPVGNSCRKRKAIRERARGTGRRSRKAASWDVASGSVHRKSRASASKTSAERLPLRTRDSVMARRVLTSG